MMRKFLKGIGGSFVLLGLLTACNQAAGPAGEARIRSLGAVTYTVTTTNDSGSGSLREAIAAANLNADSSIITFELPFPATITLDSALPQISSNVAFAGPSADRLTISGAGAHQIFSVQEGTVSFSGLTLADGRVRGNTGPDFASAHGGGGGGGAGMGGSLFMNGGSVSVENVIFSGNRAVGGLGGNGGNTGRTGTGGDGAASSDGTLGGSGAGSDGTGSGGGGGGGGLSAGGNAARGNGGGGGGTGGFGGSGGGGGGGGGGLGGGGGHGGAGGTNGLGGNGGKGGYNSTGSIPAGGGGGGGAGLGGAISVKSGTLTLKNVSFLGNSSEGGQGGTGGDDGNLSSKSRPGDPGKGKAGVLFVNAGATVSNAGGLTLRGNSAADAGQSVAPDNENVFVLSGGNLSNRAPNTPNPIAKLTEENTPVAFSANDFTSAFSDPDGDSLSKIMITSLPSGGTLSLNEGAVSVNQQIVFADLGKLSFTPNAGFGGVVTFNWKASEGIAYSAASAAVTVTVELNNRPPTAPGAPTLSSGTNPNNSGVFVLAWSASSDSDDGPVTYTLEHKKANDSGFSTVITGLTTASYSFTSGAPESEGTWVYRVKASDGSLESDYSALSGAIKVDKGAPLAPTLTPDRTPEDSGMGGWYKGSVTVGFSANGDPNLQDGSSGSGVNSASLPAPVTKNTSGEHTVSGTVSDNAGNESARSSSTVKVDATAPQITLACPTAPLFLGSTASVQWTATDAHSGLSTLANGSVTLDTSSVGSYTASAPVAQDNVGYSSAAATCTYSVGYGFEGFFRPVENGGVLNVAKAGQTIPLKWRLTDASGNPVATLSGVKVTVVALTCSLGGTTDQVEEYVSGNSGLQNLGDGYYQFNWATPKSYANSCKTAHLDLGEGTVRTALFKFTR